MSFDVLALTFYCFLIPKNSIYHIEFMITKNKKKRNESRRKNTSNWLMVCAANVINTKWFFFVITSILTLTLWRLIRFTITVNVNIVLVFWNQSHRIFSIGVYWQATYWSLKLFLKCLLFNRIIRDGGLLNDSLEKSTKLVVSSMKTIE